ncbi:MAG: glycosyltransferase [Verrucomicrobiaceae bacterium]|nr:glycosyltransferase [Verrucomicrobiaceae bacterium]
MQALLIITLMLIALAGVILWRLRAPKVKSTHLTTKNVSVIIPARDEEKRLPRLLTSLKLEAPAEILVVDDGSTDATAAIAESHGARVIRSEPLPDGWRGKTWACQQGARVASQKLFLFLDADTWLEPGGLNHILSSYQGTGALSVGPFHSVERAFEDLSMFFNLNMVLGVVPDSLFGQMMLVDAASYRSVGGHDMVKGRVLENYALTGQFRSLGIQVRSLCGKGILSLRMYPEGIHQLIEGWIKGFAGGAKQTPKSVLMLSTAWMTGLSLVPLGWALDSRALLWGIIYLAAALSVALVMSRVGRFRWASYLLYPIPLIFFYILFAVSSLRSGKKVTWKGRVIHGD